MVMLFQAIKDCTDMSSSSWCRLSQHCTLELKCTSGVQFGNNYKKSSVPRDDDVSDMVAWFGCLGRVKCWRKLNYRLDALESVNNVRQTTNTTTRHRLGCFDAETSLRTGKLLPLIYECGSEAKVFDFPRVSPKRTLRHWCGVGCLESFAAPPTAGGRT